MSTNTNSSSAALTGSQPPPAPKPQCYLLGKPTKVGPLRPSNDPEEDDFFRVDLEMETGRSAHSFVVPKDDNYLNWVAAGVTPSATACIGVLLGGLMYLDESNGLINGDSPVVIHTGPPPTPLQVNQGAKPKRYSFADAAINGYPAPFVGYEPPAEVWKNKLVGDNIVVDRWNKEHKGVLHLCGTGDSKGPIMFVGPCTLEEDYRCTYSSSPHMLRGAPGNLFHRNLASVGFKDHDWFYTTIAKYNTPKLKLKPADIKWGEPALIDEVTTIKPKIIVCLGKAVFDYFWQKSTGKATKFALKDVQGGFFECPIYGCSLYSMDTITTPFYKPEFIERFKADLTNLRRTLDEIQGLIGIERVEQHYVTIDNIATLAGVLSSLKVKQVKLLGVDCEWHGQTWVDGNLRSFQFSWEPGHAAYLKLMDEKQKYCFDQPIEVVANVLRVVFADPEVKFVGHNASADMPWMKHHLVIEVYRRFAFDTMFAQHTVNEYADLKLERCAVKYTDLGRYDIPLCLWKKDNKFDEDNEPGYGRVPDRIIIPYAIKDVDATLRLVPKLIERLRKGELLEYYYNFLLPFVTDGFFEMMESGLPINEVYLDDMREVFTRNQFMLLKQFRIALYNEACLKLEQTLRSINAKTSNDLFSEILDTVKNHIREDGSVDLSGADFADIALEFRNFVGVNYMKWALPIFQHMTEALNFNVNSTDHLKRWLFQVKGLEPLKSTKRDGFQISWEKVLAITDEDRRRSYEPAADKQTIKVYADKDPLVAQLQELKSVGNIVKAFLKGVDEDGKEQGIPKWIQGDGRIHANFALTETARPRCVHEDTVITCRDGNKRIADIRSGDEVWTHRNRWRPVSECYALPPEEMFAVTFSNGETLRATLNHRLLTQSGEWLSLRDAFLQIIKRKCYGSLSKARQRSGDMPAGSAILLRNQPDGGAGSEGGWNFSTHGVSNLEGAYGCVGFEGAAVAEIFNGQIGSAESEFRKTRKGVTALSWRLSGWRWLLDEVNEWSPVFRASDCDVRSVGNSSGQIPGQYGGASHRRGSVPQLDRQSCCGHKVRTQPNSQALQIHQRGIRITKVSCCGSHTVFDISVKEDNSYESCKCFSHNSWRPNILNWPKAVTKPVEAAFSRVQKANPKHSEKPSCLRSVVEAPSGSCIIDMDLKTAEVVALAYQAGDETMIRVLTEPDLQFACIDLNNPKKVARIGYNENSCFPESEFDQTLVVAPDDSRILRKATGEIAHPKRDLHWEMAEAVAGKPREKLDDRLFRDGVGKVGNFCLLQSSRVPTLRGAVPIQDVRPDDLIWDGEAWVAHDGVVCNGLQVTHFHQGLWATDNHEVWIENERKVLFGDARRNGWNLFRPAMPNGTTPVETGESYTDAGNRSAIEQWSLRVVDWMSALRTEVQEIFGPPGTRAISSLLLHIQSQLSRFTVLYPSNPVCSDDSALLHRYAQIIASLQGAWDQGVIQILSRFCDMGTQEMAGHGFQEFGIRPEEQPRRLLQTEYSAGDQKPESTEQRSQPANSSRHSERFSGSAPGGYLYGYHLQAQLAVWHDGGSIGGEMEKRPTCRMAKAGYQNVQTSLTKTGLVYDILNAGPRHRFVCEGVLVSNSIPYGASAPLLERLIEVNTGIKPKEGTGALMIETWETRYPDAAKFQREMSGLVEDPGRWRSLSGRVRHFFLAELSDINDVQSNHRKGISSPLERQARNFPCQELVAATTGKALLMFIEKRREMGLKSRIGILLYDAITAFSPLEEAKATSELLKNCLTTWIPWTVKGRTFNFEVDINYSFRWGVKPTKEEKERIAHYIK